MSLGALQSTQVGVTVSQLRKSDHPQISSMSQELGKLSTVRTCELAEELRKLSKGINAKTFATCELKTSSHNLFQLSTERRTVI